MGHSIEGRFPFLDYRRRGVRCRAARPAAAARARGEVRAAARRQHVPAGGGLRAPQAALPGADRPRLRRRGRARLRPRAAERREPERRRDLPARGRPAGRREVRGERRPRQRDRRDGARRRDLDDAPARAAGRESHSCPCRPADARRRRRNRPVGTPSPGGRSLTQRPSPLSSLGPRHQRLLHDSLLVAAHDLGDKPAIVTKEARLSYAELLDQAARLAHALQEQGLERGDRVAIFMDNTAACCVSIFGTLIAGGVFMTSTRRRRPTSSRSSSTTARRASCSPRRASRAPGRPAIEGNGTLKSVLSVGGRRRGRARRATSRRRSTRPSRPRPTRGRSRSTSRR